MDRRRGDWNRDILHANSLREAFKVKAGAANETKWKDSNLFLFRFKVCLWIESSRWIQPISWRPEPSTVEAYMVLQVTIITQKCAVLWQWKPGMVESHGRRLTTAVWLQKWWGGKGREIKRNVFPDSPSTCLAKLDEQPIKEPETWWVQNFESHMVNYSMWVGHGGSAVERVYETL